MLFGYIWVFSSADDALLNQQRQALEQAGVAANQLYEDLGCSRRSQRPGRQACLKALESGDTLVVWQLERFVDGRAHFLKILQDLCDRGIGLQVLTGTGSIIDSAHLNLKIVLDVVAAMTELEEQVISEATLAGLVAARAKGQKLGAPQKMTAALLRQAMTSMTSSDANVTAIAKSLNVTRATLYNYLNGDGSLKPAGVKLLEPDE